MKLIIYLKQISELLYLCTKVTSDAALKHALVTKVLNMNNFERNVIAQCEKIGSHSSQVMKTCAFI